HSSPTRRSSDLSPALDVNAASKRFPGNNRYPLAIVENQLVIAGRLVRPTQAASTEARVRRPLLDVVKTPTRDPNSGVCESEIVQLRRLRGQPIPAGWVDEPERPCDDAVVHRLQGSNLCLLHPVPRELIFGLDAGDVHGGGTGNAPVHTAVSDLTHLDIGFRATEGLQLARRA